MRLAVVLFGVALAVGLSACYASTEPATDVTGDTATLNAQGAANNGDALSNFDYWPTNTGVHSNTGNRRWPAGAKGRFSEHVRGLEANTSYSFRVCGRDASDPGPDVCAQTRTFTTGPLTNDWVQANWFVSTSYNGNVYARGGPNGENPTGTVGTSEHCNTGGCLEFDGSVTCMKVNGNRAVVGAVGTEDELGDPDPPRGASRLVYILDDDANGDKTSFISGPGTPAPTCSDASFSVQTPSGATVRDAPAP